MPAVAQEELDDFVDLVAVRVETQLRHAMPDAGRRIFVWTVGRVESLQKCIEGSHVEIQRKKFIQVPADKCFEELVRCCAASPNQTFEVLIEVQLILPAELHCQPGINYDQAEKEIVIGG